MKVLFRADAGPHIGLGHVQRSLSLAIALQKLGVESLFLTNGGNFHCERIARFGFFVELVPETESWNSADSEATLKVAFRQECDAVVVDSHEAGADYLTELRNAGIFVAARDDLALFPFSCQLVFNGNADASRLPYQSSAGDTVFLLGTEYMVLRDEFGEAPSRSINGDVQNMLVILGGTDNHDLMPRILRLLDTLPGEFSVTAVVGPFFNNATAVKSAAENAKRPIMLVHSPDSVRDLMLGADLAVSAGGQTLYELASTGCPTVAMSVAPNQRGQLLALEEAGALVSAGDAETGDVITGMGRGLTDLLADSKARVDMAAVGQSLVDGQGAQRVAGTIVNEVRQPAKTYIRTYSDKV